MGMDKNELTRILKDVPTLGPKDTPDLNVRLEFIDTQIAEYKKVVYRFYTDVEMGKRAAAKDDENYHALARSKIQEAAGNLKGALIMLSTLRHIRSDIEVELQDTKK